MNILGDILDEATGNARVRFLDEATGREKVLDAGHFFPFHAYLPARDEDPAGKDR
jgi:hypothetical protein